MIRERRDVYLVGGVAHVALNGGTCSWWDETPCGLRVFYTPETRATVVEDRKYKGARSWPVADEVQDATEPTCLMCLVHRAERE
jgi:hypothetical protein